jgi:heavy metal translocating P-type ATPase
MAQEKEEAAIPAGKAPDDTAPTDHLPIAGADPPKEEDSASGTVAQEPLPETDSAASEPETAHELDQVPSSDSDPAAEPEPTESPEPGKGELAAIAAAVAADEAAAEAAEATEPAPEKRRRILPARPSTPAALNTSAFATKTPWTHLRKLTVSAIVAWVLVLMGLLSDYALGLHPLFFDGLYAVAAVIAGVIPAIEIVRKVRQFLVPVALVPMVAAILAVIIGDWRDAAILLASYTTLLALHELILRRSEEPVQSLNAARATQATLAGASTPLPIKEVTVGDTIWVAKGEIVPLDGFVESGVTTVDESIVTGSAEPVEKHRGSDVYAGSTNLGSDIEVRVGRRPSQRTIARVARLARNALPHPSRAQVMLEELAPKYAIAMLVVGLGAFLVLFFLGDHSWRHAMERTVAFLIAASPAPLLITVMTAYRAAMANAMRHGVLFRGQDELEILGTVKTIAFDKTGTLTGGKPTVTGVVNTNTGWSDDEILIRAASAELRSGHRLGNAIVNTAEARGLEIPEPSEFTPRPGKGIIATVEGRTVAVGNANLFAELSVNIWRATEISADMRDEGQSAVLVGDRENVRGVIGVSDPLRPEAPEIVDDLSYLNIRRTAMLTGDDEVVANVIASAAGLREVYADLLPEEKLGVVRQMEQSAPVGMIAGAGENSPTLAIATSGIALGSVSSDVTREPAGVLLFGGKLAELPFALWIAQTARRTTNIGLGLIIAVMAILATGALVVGIPPLAVILISFAATLIVLLAGLRLLTATRRLPRRRVIPEPLPDAETPSASMPLPKPRYVIDDDDEDEEDDL